MTIDANKRLAAKLAITAVLMFGFGYALIPLYNVYCRATGINGKTGWISAAAAAREKEDTGREITVEFDTNISDGLPWVFKPLRFSLRAHPGAVTEAVFYAENLSNDTVVGQAIPSVVPNRAASYFNETQCFCFTRQTLGPGEHRYMPVRFIINAGLPPRFRTLTLSYTFFRAPGSVEKTAVAAGPAPDETPEKIL